MVPWLWTISGAVVVADGLYRGHWWYAFGWLAIGTYVLARREARQVRRDWREFKRSNRGDW